MSRHCGAASPSAATVSSACTSGEASSYAPKASPRVWPNERSRSRMGLVPGALYCRSAAHAAERYSPAHLWARSATAPLCSSRARGHW